MMISAVDTPPERSGLLRFFVSFLAVFCLAGCGVSDPSPHVLSGMTMGTTWVVKFRLPASWEKSRVDLLRLDLARAIHDELEKVNNLMSVFRAESEISRFNRFRAGQKFPVSPEMAALVAMAMNVYHQSNGAFDITIGPVIRLWGFGPDGERRIPAESEIRSALERSGSRHLVVYHEPPALRKNVDGLECNLSALAKGYGVDCLAQLLKRKKINDFLVEIGGEVRTRGERVGGGPWQIGIMEPMAAGGLQRVIRLENRSMATSGDYQNYFEVDGTRYSHTFDPRSGRPVTHNLASVTVVADTCMEADAWATALLVMGPEKAKELALQRSWCVFLIERDARGYREFMTPSFRRLLLSEKGAS
ncbi:MAG: FAD:protein FMN transferase [Acidobacteriota bacterium]|jgi:thiamine biosynthesis lipoprotein|nr:FAD:protein FMN transferase [Acidobacteriota bacterium]